MDTTFAYVLITDALALQSDYVDVGFQQHHYRLTMINLKQERAWTLSRIKYSINPVSKNLPYKVLNNEFLSKIRTEKSKLYPESPNVDIDKFTDYLLINTSLNKIHSCTLDIYETLPNRPDMAFDSMWRSLEALITRYAIDKWNIDVAKTSLVELMHRISSEVIMCIYNHESKIANALDALLKATPISIGRFVIVRMLCDREIRLASQHILVAQRAKNILEDDLLQAFQHRYLENGNLSGKNHYDGARKILRLINGERLTFNGIVVNNPSKEKVIEFLLSVVLYTARCERYHGDYFSSFNSALAQMDTYRHWYWLLTVTHSFFWILFLKYISFETQTILTPTSVAAAIEKNTDFLQF